MPILFHDRHSNRLKISRATISHRVDAVTKRSLASIGVSSCDAPRFNRTLIMHANVYDQDQGLTGRYHNTTLQIK